MKGTCGILVGLLVLALVAFGCEEDIDQEAPSASAGGEALCPDYDDAEGECFRKCLEKGVSEKECRIACQETPNGEGKKAGVWYLCKAGDWYKAGKDWAKDADNGWDKDK